MDPRRCLSGLHRLTMHIQSFFMKIAFMLGGKDWKLRLLVRLKRRGKVQEGIKNKDTIMQVESASNVIVMDGLMLAKSTMQNSVQNT